MWQLNLHAGIPWWSLLPEYLVVLFCFVFVLIFLLVLMTHCLHHRTFECNHIDESGVIDNFLSDL